MKQFLGEFEYLVMLGVLHTDMDACGIEVHRVLDAAEREPTLGAVYATLERLEKKGRLFSRLSPKRHMQGGRPRRIYTMTPAGREALELSYNLRRNLERGVTSKFRKAKADP